MIKLEVERTGSLNRAYIPILQNLSPGEIQHATNALDFAKVLVAAWLKDYKFKKWATHSNGHPVTPEERAETATEIAADLCNHSKWLTHGRSIKIPDLEAMRLKITDYSKNNELFDAVRRYHVLLQLTFDSPVYKIFETPVSQIYRYRGADPMPQQAPPPKNVDHAVVEVTCHKCSRVTKIQANFVKDVPLEQDCLPYPSNDTFQCPQCRESHNLSDLRRQLEMQVKKGVVLS